MPKSEVEPCVFVVMGGTGDLMHRKLLPALYHLATQDLIPAKFIILGCGRRSSIDDASFRNQARKALEDAHVPGSGLSSRWCDECLYYSSVQEGNPDSFRALDARITELEEAHQLPGNRAFYLALPPDSFPAMISGLGEARLNRSAGWTRLVIEKPFGSDLKSAQDLNQLVHRYFDESQVYRIDHYLGKETVQNLFVLRFANPIFETLWNRDRVDNVQITVAETVGLEGRAGYYENSGVLRDMVENHLTQLLCVVAMEVPSAFRADAILNEKLKVLDSIEPLQASNIALGQYGPGQIAGDDVVGYCEEPGVAADSQVPTFAALKLSIANWRWHGVPFYLRTGKRLSRKVSEIIVNFRCPPVMIFQPFGNCEIHANSLMITIQPDEGFDLNFQIKVPGPGISLQKHSLHFRYKEVFPEIPEAYETLLLDFLTGDQSLFVRSDLVESSWRLYTPILDHPGKIEPYASGTWGPAAADQLLQKEGKRWYTE